MLNVGVRTFELPKNLLLILAILKKTDRAPLRSWSGVDDALKSQDSRIVRLADSTNNPAARLVMIEAITFVKNCGERRFGHNYPNIFRLLIFHIKLHCHK